MSKIAQSKYKISRSLEVALWGGTKDAYNKKNYFPGQHGPVVARKITSHSVQLKAKQKLKRYYNIFEKQFRKIFSVASQKKGNVSENLIELLERRLDAILYRSNIASSIFAAGQLISHGHIMVNNKKVDIRSYTLKDNDVVAVRERAKNLTVIKQALSKAKNTVPDYIKVGNDGLSVTFLRKPTPSEVPYEAVMEPHLIVEFYSK